MLSTAVKNGGVRVINYFRGQLWPCVLRRSVVPMSQCTPAMIGLGSGMSWEQPWRIRCFLRIATSTCYDLFLVEMLWLVYIGQIHKLRLALLLPSHEVLAINIK